ncbi:MAG: hypothetical protein ABI939_01635, partial [Anaerolineaceae bacterium]
LLLGGCALVAVAGGTWLALAGSGSDGVAVTSRAEETSALPAGSAAESAQATATNSATAPPPVPSATATGTALATNEPAASGPLATRPAGPAPIPPPTAAPAVQDLPTMTANEVLALSRDVRLPSGTTFAACGAIGPEGEPWPLSVHLYYTGRGGWVVATHRGDASLLFDEATRSFQLDTVTRAGC